MHILFTGRHVPRFDTNRTFEFDIHERFRAIYLRVAYVIPADDDDIEEHEDPTTGLVCMSSTSTPVMIPINSVPRPPAHRPVCLAKSVNAVTSLGESNGGWGFFGLPDAPASLPSVVLLDPNYGFGGGGGSSSSGGAHGGCSVSVSDFYRHPESHYSHHQHNHHSHLRPPHQQHHQYQQQQHQHHQQQQQHLLCDDHQLQGETSFSFPGEERGAECLSVPCLDLSCRTFLPSRTLSGYENMTELMEQVEQYIDATSKYA